MFVYGFGVDQGEDLRRIAMELVRGATPSS
jgi:hypothetical protein